MEREEILAEAIIVRLLVEAIHKIRVEEMRILLEQVILEVIVRLLVVVGETHILLELLVHQNAVPLKN